VSNLAAFNILLQSLQVVSAQAPTALITMKKHTKKTKEQRAVTLTAQFKTENVHKAKFQCKPTDIEEMLICVW